MYWKPFILSILMLASANALAQDSLNNYNPFTFNAFARGSIQAGGNDYEIATAFGELTLETKYKRGSAIIGAEVRIRDGLFFDEHRTDIELREAYAGYQGKKLSVYLGNQVINWGRTDGFNPTNNIGSFDYFLLTPDPDDQKMGKLMLRTDWRLGSSTELVVILNPIYKPSVYRYNLFDLNEYALFIDGEMPEVSFKNSTFALRLNVERPAIGFSVSAFHGYDPFYGFRASNIELFPDVKITYQPSYYLKDVVGADFAIPLQSFILRGEAAYDFTTDYGTEMQVPNPSLNYVLALEREFNGYLCIFQYIGKYSSDWKELTEPVLLDSLNPAAQIQYALDRIDYETTKFNRLIFHQQEETNHALFLVVRKSYFYEVLEAELSGYYNITSKEYLIRPQLRWHITDALTASLGASYMFGEKDEIFDYAGKVLNGVCLEMMVKF